MEGQARTQQLDHEPIALGKRTADEATGEPAGPVLAELRRLVDAQHRVEAALRSLAASQQQLHAQHQQLTEKDNLAAVRRNSLDQGAPSSGAEGGAGEVSSRRRRALLDETEPEDGPPVMGHPSYGFYGSEHDSAGGPGNDGAPAATPAERQGLLLNGEEKHLGFAAEPSNLMARSSLASTSTLGHGHGWASTILRNSEDISAASAGSFRGVMAPNLPRGWPAVIEIREVPEAASEPIVVIHTSNSRSTTRPLVSPKETSTLARLVLHPGSNLRTVFDIAGMLVLMYDLTVIPYVLAWDISTDGFLSVLFLLTVSFWTLDVILNFVTGYYSDGDLVMQPSLIHRRYLRTWFVPDVAVVFCDWLSVFLTGPLSSETEDSSTSSSLKMLRFAKLGRLLRIVGILRMFRFARVLEEFIECHVSENLRLVLRVMTLVAGILWFNHLMCCAWFAVGRGIPTDTGQRWTDVTLGDPQVPYLDTNRVYQYITAFHWSVSQITLGAIEVYSTNSAERLYNIICLLVGLLFGSTLVSSLSATMVELEMRHKDARQKLRTLRQFLREHNINRGIGVLVQQQATKRLKHREKLTEKDVPVLALLSATLLADLRTDLFQPYLISHPLLRLCSQLDLGVFKSFCNDAVDFSFLRPQDLLFTPGQKSSAAYNIVKGSLTYTQDPETSGVECRSSQDINEGQWLCEAVFWSDWLHVGTAEACTPCQLVTVQPEELLSKLGTNGTLRGICHEYCRHFHKRIVTAVPPTSSLPSDLEVPFTDYADLVLAMTKEVQVTIGLAAMDHAAESRTWTRGRVPGGLEKLRDEIVRGKSTVVVTGAGEVKRVVSVIALHIEDDQGRLFAQLGKLEETISAACALPGAKQERGEMTADAAKRVLFTKIQPMADLVNIIGTKREIRETESKEYGVRTKYLRTVCLSRFSGTLDAGICSVKESYLAAQASGNAEGPTPLQDFLQRDVYLFRDKAKAAFYTWLEPLEFEQLSKPSSDNVLLEWLSALEEPDDTVKCI